jgi:hypothetical protein
MQWGYTAVTEGPWYLCCPSHSPTLLPLWPPVAWVLHFLWHLLWYFHIPWLLPSMAATGSQVSYKTLSTSVPGHETEVLLLWAYRVTSAELVGYNWVTRLHRWKSGGIWLYLSVRERWGGKGRRGDSVAIFEGAVCLSGAGVYSCW